MATGQLMDGRYRLVDQLGSGGMSVVWRAHDSVLERDVAIKLLSPELGADSDLLPRIRLEARSVARLRHPNVVEVHDYGEAVGDNGPPTPYVVMELIEGRSLDQLLTAGALPWRLAVVVGAQVSAALAAAHGQGIVHRDIKPGNVMVTEAGVKLVDFGISATVGEADAADGQVLGTPAYLAPERIDGGPVRPATDVYALGLLLHRMLAGHLPWETSTVTEMLLAHRYQDPAALPPIVDLPPAVTDLCRRCLAKQPDDRPTAAEVARVLGEAAGLAPAALLLTAVDAGVDTPGAGAPVDGASGADAPDAFSSPTVLFAAGATPAPTPAPTSVPTSAPGSPRRPGTWRGGRRRVAAMVAAGVLLAGALGAWAVGVGSADDRTSGISAAAEPDPARCRVDYAVRSAVNGRSSTAVTVVNSGAAALADWRLSFDLPDEQRLVRGWSGQWRQTGRSVQARGTALPARASVSTGFDAAYGDVNGLPALFRLNGNVCQSVLSVEGRTTPPAGPTSGPAGQEAGPRDGGATPTGARRSDAGAEPGSGSDSDEAAKDEAAENDAAKEDAAKEAEKAAEAKAKQAEAARDKAEAGKGKGKDKGKDEDDD